MENLRCLVRPYVTILGFTVLSAGFLLNMISAEAYTGIVGGVISFWFMSREKKNDRDS
jgi:hypothetical protein